jgi:hypothetical protein
MIERVAANAVMHLELGPKTRGMTDGGAYTPLMPVRPR